ncbi:uncharacterized protein LOC142628624 [Castanea sativa]|uniref:uncharacterized protein LOC142628624 n=1 Tax=Castanea sativa TaxID=21020 RepID=UPI003F65210C
MDGLPTMMNLHKRGVNGCELCPCCGKEPESVLHSLVRCEVARRIWDFWVNCPVDFLSNAMDITNVALKICESGITQDLETFLGVAWISSRLQNRLSNLLSSSVSGRGKKRTKPPPRTFKINVDRVTSENGRSSSVGVAIRDSTGMITAAWCKYLQGQYSVTKTEALAVECGVLLARDMELSHIIIESDALAAFQGILAAEIEGNLGHVY